MYNGIETNIEVTETGRVKRIERDWYGKGNGKYLIVYGEVDLSKLINPKGYYQLTVKVKGLPPKTVCVHQMVASVFLGYVFNGHSSVVDHIDSNRLNNKLCNLRVISCRENCSREKTYKSKLPTGVYIHTQTKKYIAQIQINKKITYLGSFKTPEEASEKYQSVLKTLL